MASDNLARSDAALEALKHHPRNETQLADDEELIEDVSSLVINLLHLIYVRTGDLRAVKHVIGCTDYFFEDIGENRNDQTQEPLVPRAAEAHA